MNKYIIFFTIFSLKIYANVGVIAIKKGNVILVSNSKNVKLKKGMEIKNNDTIQTKSKSFVKIIFNDNSMVDIEENSSLKINFVSSKKEKKSVLNFLFGKIKSIVGKRKSSDSYEIKSGATSWGIRGTEVDISKPKNTEEFLINLWNGSVDLTNKNGETFVLSEGNEYKLSDLGSLDSRILEASEILQNIQSKNAQFSSPATIISEVSASTLSNMIKADDFRDTSDITSDETIIEDETIENMNYPYSILVKQNDVSIATNINNL